MKMKKGNANGNADLSRVMNERERKKVTAGTSLMSRR